MTPKLIASCWTSAGDAAPGRGTEISPVPLEERINLVAQTGWAGIGLAWADLVEARNSIGYEELRRRIHAAGIELIEVEFLDNWWTTGNEREVSDRSRRELFEAARALDAIHIKVGAGTVEGEILPLNEIAGHFTDLAAEAQDAGIKLALEATPFSHLPTIREAVELVTRADNPAAGLMVDIWHTSKVGIGHRDVWKIVPLEKVHAVEIDDGFFDSLGTMFEESSNRRAYCGEGEFDTADFVQSTIDAGWTGPWGVEIISDEHRNLPAAEGIRRAFDTAAASFPAGV
ncbi:sugar phosphate isomerase/epimerase family protein [Corynebacterium pacaense]|uniref:sugar phosphate isomerase/epimerase family protein n=1 Tax=Corynebacterium pacaense TaxID=1816684 RepID=UPI0009BC5738|nr:sugar phosphate isomerase/epimerase [Corynebacterium pacaense]